MKELSRQVRWQQKKRAAGLCTQCGKKANQGALCPKCRGKVRIISRNSYRREHGIPLTATLLKSGRPRV